MHSSVSIPTRTSTGSGGRIAAIIPASDPDATSSWRRMVAAVDPELKGAFALQGTTLRPDVAYEMQQGALVVTCDTHRDRRDIRLLRAETGGLLEVKAWRQRSPLGARIVAYIARRLPPRSAVPVRIERIPNRYHARCARCRQTVPSGAGDVAPRVGERCVVTHTGPCPPAPPPPETIDPNRHPGQCFACDGWVKARTGVAVLTEANSGAARYRPMHRGECPADAPPGPENRVANWCADCASLIQPGDGYWHRDELHHAGPCPPPVARTTWLIRRRSGDVEYRAGQVRRVRLDLRDGGDPVPPDAPGCRVLAEQYTELIATVLDVRTGRDRLWQEARIRTATPAEAEDLLAAEVARAVDARPHSGGFKARFTAERITRHRAELLRLRFLGAPAAENPWLAEITGRDPDYGYARDFLRADRDYANANSKGTRGVEYCWTLTVNRVYEAWYRTSHTQSHRVFLRATPEGDVVEISRQEVETWLNAAPAWADAS